MIDALNIQGRVLAASIRREIDVELGSPIMFLAMVFEPMFHIGVIALWHFMIRLQPIYGTSTILFISSGLYPVFVFIHLATAFSTTLSATAGSRRYPIETPMDRLIAKAYLRLVSYVLAGLMLFAGIYTFVTPDGYPWNWSPLIEGFAALTVLGIGTGLCNAVLNNLVHLWRHTVGAVTRTLILFSGVLFVPDLMMDNIRRWLSYNPVMHAVALCRKAFYPQYPSVCFDRAYMWTFAFTILVLGLCLERIYRRRLEVS